MSPAATAVIDKAKARYRKGDFPMKPSFRFRFLASVWVVLGVAILGESSLHADPASPKVFAVLIGDTADPRVGTSVEKDLSRVRKALEKSLPTGSVHFDELAGDELSRASIDSSILKVQGQITDQDTVFCYVATRSEFTVEPLLVCSPTGDRMSRGLLRQRLELLTPKPRLIVLITDFRNGHQPFERHWLEFHTDEHNHEVGRSLFQHPRGFVDFTSDDKGQGRATVEEGGELTRAWCTALLGSPDVSTTWEAVRDRMDRLNRRFHRNAANNDNSAKWKIDPRLLQVALQTDSKTRARLGLIPLTTNQTRKDCVEIQEVLIESPATNLILDLQRFTLVAGMHGIKRFNNKPVRSAEDLETEVVKSASSATIEVFRLNSPSVVKTYEVELDGTARIRADKRAGAPWGLRLSPVDVSNGQSWMVVECVAPGLSADAKLESDANPSPIHTLVPGDRIRIAQTDAKTNLDEEYPWDSLHGKKLRIEVRGVENEYYPSVSLSP
jgi:hypothetical protein